MVYLTGCYCCHSWLILQLSVDFSFFLELLPRAVCSMYVQVFAESFGSPNLCFANSLGTIDVEVRRNQPRYT